MSDYLFDKEGEPDEEIGQLEQMLAPLAFRGGVLALPPPRRPHRSIIAPLTWATAALFVGVCATLLVVPQPDPTPAPMVVSWTMQSSGRTSQLALGTWTETDEGGASLRVDDVGSVELGAHTRARITTIGKELRLMELDYGTLSARITAPARQFAIKTAHVTAIDLGCAFTLEVDRRGAGRLVVTEGSVALADESGHERVITAGSECELDGNAAPYVSTATSAFRQALAAYAHDPSALRGVLAAAQRSDALTLEYLATRDAASAALIRARLGALSRPLGHHKKSAEVKSGPLPDPRGSHSLGHDPFFDGDR